MDSSGLVKHALHIEPCKAASCWQHPLLGLRILKTMKGLLLLQLCSLLLGICGVEPVVAWPPHSVFTETYDLGLTFLSLLEMRKLKLKNHIDLQISQDGEK